MKFTLSKLFWLHGAAEFFPSIPNSMTKAFKNLSLGSMDMLSREETKKVVGGYWTNGHINWGAPPRGGGGTGPDGPTPCPDRNCLPTI